MQRQTQLIFKKWLKLSNAVQVLPSFYIGNKHLYDYVKNISKIVIVRNGTHKVVCNPRIYHSLYCNYRELKLTSASQINKYDLKTIAISYRITLHLISNNESCDIFETCDKCRQIKNDYNV